MKRIIPLLLALSLLCIPAQAAEIDADQVYCFSAEDFQQADDPLVGICITGLPASRTGTVKLGNRVVQPGDILTAEQVAQLTFNPIRTEYDGTAQVTYLPIYDGRVAPSATMTIAIRGKEDKAPVAQDFTVETYKNLPIENTLKCHDPEGESLTYTIQRQPRRGSIQLHDDGSFTYTPKKNKVGVDSFTYTATDPAGKVSREATVTIQILKPTDDKRYSDTSQFEAEWLRHTGIFQGEKLGNALCFQPNKPVSRGEFIATVMRLLDIPTAETDNDSVPKWLQPYYAAALRSGFMTNFPTEEFDAPITTQEAAVLLQNIFNLDVGTGVPDGPSATNTSGTDESVPSPNDECLSPAEEALAVMNENGLLLTDSETLTRAHLATLLYQVSHLSPL